MASMSESGCHQFWLSAHSFLPDRIKNKMSEATLFSFGAVIFIIVFTGASLFGMAAMKEKQDSGL